MEPEHDLVGFQNKHGKNLGTRQNYVYSEQSEKTQTSPIFNAVSIGERVVTTKKVVGPGAGMLAL